MVPGARGLAAVRGVLGARPRAPVTMQPSPRPPSAPPAHPVAPEISRGYGWLVLGGALVWAALVALVLIAFGSLLSSLVLAVGEGETPPPAGRPRGEVAAGAGMAEG